MGQRHYDVDNEKLPSVTTIPSQTQSEEKKASLSNWQQKAKHEATRIRDQSAERGTIMHRVLEGYLTGHRHADLSDLGTQAGKDGQNYLGTGFER